MGLPSTLALKVGRKPPEGGDPLLCGGGDLLLKVLNLLDGVVLSLDLLKVLLEGLKRLLRRDSCEAMDLPLPYPDTLRAKVAAEGEPVDADGVCEGLCRSELLGGGYLNPLLSLVIPRAYL